MFASLSIYGLYTYDNSIFDNLVLPADFTDDERNDAHNTTVFQLILTLRRQKSNTAFQFFCLEKTDTSNDKTRNSATTKADRNANNQANKSKEPYVVCFLLDVYIIGLVRIIPCLIIRLRNSVC